MGDRSWAGGWGHSQGYGTVAKAQMEARAMSGTGTVAFKKQVSRLDVSVHVAKPMHMLKPLCDLSVWSGNEAMRRPKLQDTETIQATAGAWASMGQQHLSSKHDRAPSTWAHE